jgi:hypothetical protein
MTTLALPTISRSNSRKENIQNGVIILFFVAIATAMIIGMSTQANYAETARDRYGVSSDKSYSVQVSQQTETTSDTSGTMLLFAGSITSSSRSTIRVGLTTEDGHSYILDVDLKRVVFNQHDDDPSFGRFTFAGGPLVTGPHTLQELVNVGMDKLEITLTSKQYKQLVG